MEANSREPGRWKAIIILKAFHLSSGFVLTGSSPNHLHAHLSGVVSPLFTLFTLFLVDA